MSNSAISQVPTAAEPSPGLIPGWLTWFSPAARQWHARKQGSAPPVLVHDDDLDGLRRQAAGR